ncbi:hypothetical protein JTE90_003817 [Oedothorax gibbosus]|uniref:Uncharacterized protein n=1 Tax=Oedothorax gibbosus TaxID=931172 RepID=A0AAV6VG71_9ARAC|nr:hypothetical protein JTE90_003817 [Oedothorax gibbosus]
MVVSVQKKVLTSAEVETGVLRVSSSASDPSSPSSFLILGCTRRMSTVGKVDLGGSRSPMSLPRSLKVSKLRLKVPGPVSPERTPLKVSIIMVGPSVVVVAVVTIAVFLWCLKVSRSGALSQWCSRVDSATSNARKSIQPVLFIRRS